MSTVTFDGVAKRFANGFPELQRSLGTTMFYVTHDQVEAMTMGDRVAVMNAGMLEQVATPNELYSSPATAFVAGFIGSPPMNRILVAQSDGILRSGSLDLSAMIGEVAQIRAVRAAGTTHVADDARIDQRRSARS